LWLLAPSALAQSAEDAAQRQMKEDMQEVLSMLEMEKWNQAGKAAGIDMPRMLENILAGEQPADVGQLLKRGAEELKEHLMSRKGLLLSLLAPSLLCGLLERFREAFGGKGAAEICGWACFLWVAAASVGECALQAQNAGRTVDALSEGMQALFPLLLTLLSAVGAGTSAAFFQPAVVAASGTMTTLAKHVSFSLALSYAVLAALDSLSDALPLKGLKSLVRSAAVWTLGICFTVFAGVMTIQGFGAAAKDGVTLRTAQYAVDRMIPVVGGMLADTADTLAGCALLVKNALGVTGLLALAGYLVFPLLRLLSSVLTLKICAAIAEPAADGRAVRCMRDAADAMTLLAITQLCIAAMFFLLIVQLLVVGNMTVMLR